LITVGETCVDRGKNSLMGVSGLNMFRYRLVRIENPGSWRRGRFVKVPVFGHDDCWE
jgi:hypothetical protein